MSASILNNVKTSDVTLNASDTGITAKNGGIVTAFDAPFQQANGKVHTSTSVVAGVAGDLVVEGVDGEPIAFRNLPAGRQWPVAASRVLTNATFQGPTVITTTAGNIVWFGGR